MLTLKETAELYRLALLGGWVATDEVAGWTDRVIERVAQPDVSILEASVRVRRPPYEMAEALGQVPGQFDERAVNGALLGLMHRAVLRDRTLAARTAAALYSMALHGAAPDEHASSLMWRFDDDLAIARDGVYGDPEQIINEMIQFLSEYPEPVIFAS